MFLDLSKLLFNFANYLLISFVRKSKYCGLSSFRCGCMADKPLKTHKPAIEDVRETKMSHPTRDSEKNIKGLQRFSSEKKNALLQNFL